MGAAYVVLALAALASSCMVVASRRIVHGALYLVVSFLAMAGIFLILGAEFLAAVQVIVYAGSVVVLFVFVAMTVGFGETANRKLSAGGWLLGALLGLLILVELIAGLFPLARSAGVAAPPLSSAEIDRRLGGAVFLEGIVPLEVFSLIVLAVMLGIAALRREGRERR